MKKPEDEEKEADFATKLAGKLIDNLQVKINRIHIRVEDYVSNPKVEIRNT